MSSTIDLDDHLKGLIGDDISRKLGAVYYRGFLPMMPIEDSIAIALHRMGRGPAEKYAAFQALIAGHDRGFLFDGAIALTYYETHRCIMGCPDLWTKSVDDWKAFLTATLHTVTTQNRFLASPDWPRGERNRTNLDCVEWPESTNSDLHRCLQAAFRVCRPMWWYDYDLRVAQFARLQYGFIVKNAFAEQVAAYYSLITNDDQEFCL